MTKQSGQVLVMVIATLGVVLFTVLAIIAGAQAYYQNAYYSTEAEKAMALAEAGVDKGLNSLNKDPVGYNGETETFFGDGSYSVTITNIDAGNKKLTAIGYIPNKTNPKVKRSIAIQVSKGTGLSFNYGLQIGEGGLEIGNNSILDGSIYSNGDISGGDATTVDGDVYVAGGAQPSADQVSDCEGVNCQEYVFGKNVSGEDRRDVAQSFKPSETNVLNKVSVKLKRTGSPSNPIVRIMSDSGGKPDKNGILATGTLSADLVSRSSLSFVDVSFSSSPALNAGTTYWIMIHADSLNSSNYWHWSNDLAQSYGNGFPEWSSNWQSGNPAWTSISGDLGFKTFMGGVVTSLSLANGSQITGDVHANDITGNMTINGDAYFQSLGPQVTVNGTSHPGSADPPPAVFPVSDANITDWQNQAVNPDAGGGETYGDINGCNMTLGPGKIIGNLTLGNSCTVTVKSPLWITGNITTGNSSKFVLDSSYGFSSGVVIAGGTVEFGNGGDIRGSGSEGSYLMLLSAFDSTQTGTEVAIEFGNSPVSGIVYAPKGIIKLGNGGSFKEFSGWKIILGNSSTLSYSTGLASTFFSSDPTGAYSLVSGTYQVK